MDKAVEVEVEITEAHPCIDIGIDIDMHPTTIPGMEQRCSSMTTTENTDS